MKTCLCSVVVLLSTAVASAADMKTVTISNDGSAVMTIRVPQNAKLVTIIETKDLVLNLWIVPTAKTVPEAIAGLDEVIKSEVLKFTAYRAETITVAGTEGKHLMGTGIDADDEVPATVDVVVFMVGKTVLVACVHGEGDTALRQRQPMLNALKTVKAP